MKLRSEGGDWPDTTRKTEMGSAATPALTTPKGGRNCDKKSV